jgi:hypothetical protein
MNALTNFIGDNPHMAVPPSWWLQRLYDFDRDLVVVPSRQRPFAYVLARRARRSGAIHPANVSERHNDTAMCASYGLVPVSLILRHGITWTIDNLLADLRARDTWRQPQMADQVDALDATNEKKLKASIRDDMWNRSGDAWRSYQARTGQRVSLPASPVARPAGTGSSPFLAAAGV